MADERRAVLVVLPILMLALVLLTVLGIYRYFDPDEIESLRAGWQLLCGRAIYRNFFEHHHPFFYLTLSAGLALLPERAETLVWFRGLNLGLILAVLATTFWIGRRLYGLAAALVALVLLTTTFIAIQKMIELRPDNLQSALGLLGVALLIHCFDRPRLVTALASGFAFGLCFATLQKAVFLLLPIAVIVGIRLLQRVVRWREAWMLVAGFAAALLPFVIWLAATGSLRLFWQLNYGLNFDQAYAAGPMETMRTDPQVFRVLVDSMGLNGTLWAFAAAGALMTARPSVDVSRREVRLQREIAAIAAFLVLWVVVFNKFYWQYYTPAFPFLAIIAGGALVTVLQKHWIALASLLLVACVNPLWQIRDVTAGSKSNGWQVQMFKTALALTRPGDPVIDTRLLYNLYRPDPLYMGFIARDGLMPRALRHVTGMSESVLAVVAAKQPVLVDMAALPPGAWPSDPHLAGYEKLSASEGLGEVLILSSRRPVPP